MSVPPGRNVGNRPEVGPPQQPQTQTTRGWKGLNLTDSRLSIEDDELAWCENAMIVGKSIQTLPLYNTEPTRPYNGTPVHVWGGMLTISGTPTPVALIFYADGAAYQRNLLTDADVLIAAAGTFGAAVGGASNKAVALWRDSPVLILDPTAGYCSWDGATFAVIDATRTGDALAVFQSRAWLKTAARTVQYTAPNTNSDFAALNGAGSFVLTDEVFPGPIRSLHSSVEQLWIVGSEAVDALGNVATAAGVTTFSLTNAVKDTGASFVSAVVSWLRAVALLRANSAYALLGVTPQRISDKIDRLFRAGDTYTSLAGATPWSAIATINGRPVLCFLVSFPSGVLTSSTSAILCFSDGRWFIVAPGTAPGVGGRVTAILSAPIRSQFAGFDAYGLWAVSVGGYIYPVFQTAGMLGTTLTDPTVFTSGGRGTYKISSRLHDFGGPLNSHQTFKVGFDFMAPSDVASHDVTLSLTTEAETRALAAATVTMQAVADSPLSFRYGLHRPSAAIAGQRIGWTITGNCADRVTLEAAHIQHTEGREWAGLH